MDTVNGYFHYLEWEACEDPKYDIRLDDSYLVSSDLYSDD